MAAEVVDSRPCIGLQFAGSLITIVPGGKWQGTDQPPTIRVELGTKRVAAGSDREGPKHARCRLDDVRGMTAAQVRELASALSLAADIMTGEKEVPGYVT